MMNKILVCLNVVIISQQLITPSFSFIQTINKVFLSKDLSRINDRTYYLKAYQDFTEKDDQPLYNNKNKQKDETNTKESSWSKGRVTMLGSGPGDPNLLTVAAYKLLTNSNNNTLIISDRLVAQEILDLIPSKTEVKIARKHPGCAEQAQEEIYTWTKQGLDQGKHVIRLKIGDPFVFGRGGEEVLRFRSFGYEPTIIPGVSASLSAPLLGKIPITHRGVSNQVVMCTGYGRNGTNPDLIQYHKEQTVVFLMAVGRLREISQNLIKYANYPQTTPVGIIEKAGCVDQRIVIGNLITIADIAVKNNIKAPSTIVVGECVHVLYDDFGEDEKFVTGLISDATLHLEESSYD